MPKEQPAAAEKKLEQVRVNTADWLVEQAGGGFRYLMAGINQAGVGQVGVEDRVKQCLWDEDGGRAEPLSVVAITDGAKAIRGQSETIFGHPVPVILAWSHLEKKVWELLS